PPPTSPLFPYTTLFRSDVVAVRVVGDRAGRRAAEDRPAVEARVAELDERGADRVHLRGQRRVGRGVVAAGVEPAQDQGPGLLQGDRKSTRLNSSHSQIS